ncbi:MAG TPA: type II secretion system F family protein [Actinomycetota bacterium]|nr:type II secretion system F family protein [Actinomycetota bacterium]
MSPLALLAGILAAASVTAALETLRSRDGDLLATLASPVAPSRRSRRWLAWVGTSPLGRLVGYGVSSGSPGAAELAGLKLVVPVLVGVTLLLAPAPLPLLVPVAALLAYRLPDMWLARTARLRRRAAGSELPLFLDLLAVASSAGLPAQLAAREALTAVRGPLGDELRATLRATDLGGRWRDELRAAAERLRLPELARTASVLSRSERLGSSFAGEVGRLAADVRESRRAAATERARTAPVKMLFPLVFLILPAFLLLTVVPVLLATVRSFD